MGIALSSFTKPQLSRMRRLARIVLRDAANTGNHSVSEADADRLCSIGCLVQTSHIREEGTWISVMVLSENKPYGKSRFALDCLRAKLLTADEVRPYLAARGVVSIPNRKVVGLIFP